MNSAERNENCKAEEVVTLVINEKQFSKLPKKKALHCARGFNALICLLFGIKSQEEWAKTKDLPKWHVQIGTKLVICEPEFLEV